MTKQQIANELLKQHTNNYTSHVYDEEEGFFTVMLQNFSYYHLIRFDLDGSIIEKTERRVFFIDKKKLEFNEISYHKTCKTDQLIDSFVGVDIE